MLSRAALRHRYTLRPVGAICLALCLIAACSADPEPVAGPNTATAAQALTSSITELSPSTVEVQQKPSSQAPPTEKGNANSSRPDPINQVAALRQLPFDASRVDVARQILNDSGVLILDGFGADEPAAMGPVTVSDWQLRNMAAQAANGGGVTSEALGALAPSPADQPQIPYLIAAWALDYDSAGAHLSRALLGPENLARPQELLIPDLVLTLFLADATRESGGPDRLRAHADALTDPEADRVGVVGGSTDGPCTAVTSFVHRAIGSVVTALQVNTARGGFLGFLGKIWNRAVELAGGLVEGLVKTVTKPVADAMITVFGAMATIAQVSSFVTQWRTTLTADPDRSTFGVDGNVVTGTVTIEVHHDQIPIPEVALDCADSVGVDLRHAGSTAGSKLTWDPINSGRADLSATETAGDSLDESQKAVYTYRTGQEDSDTAAHGEQHAGLLNVRVAVHRNDVASLQRLVQSMLLSQIPEVIRPFVAPVAQQLLGSALDRLSALADVTGTTRVAVTYHSAPHPTSPAEPPASSPTPAAGETAPVVGQPACPSAIKAAAATGLAITSFTTLPASEVLGSEDSHDTMCIYANAEQGTAAMVRIGPDSLVGLRDGQPPDGATPVSVPGALWAVTLPAQCTPDACGVYLGYPATAAGIVVQGLGDRDKALRAATALAAIVTTR